MNRRTSVPFRRATCWVWQSVRSKSMRPRSSSSVQLNLMEARRSSVGRLSPSVVATTSPCTSTSPVERRVTVRVLPPPKTRDGSECSSTSTIQPSSMASRTMLDTMVRHLPEPTLVGSRSARSPDADMLTVLSTQPRSLSVHVRVRKVDCVGQSLINGQLSSKVTVVPLLRVMSAIVVLQSWWWGRDQ